MAQILAESTLGKTAIIDSAVYFEHFDGLGWHVLAELPERRRCPACGNVLPIVASVGICSICDGE